MDFQRGFAAALHWDRLAVAVEWVDDVEVEDRLGGRPWLGLMRGGGDVLAVPTDGAEGGGREAGGGQRAAAEAGGSLGVDAGRGGTLEEVFGSVHRGDGEDGEMGFEDVGWGERGELGLGGGQAPGADFRCVRGFGGEGGGEGLEDGGEAGGWCALAHDGGGPFGGEVVRREYRAGRWMGG